MRDKRNIYSMISIIVIFDALYLWFAIPLISSVFRYAPLAARSSHDVPIAVAAYKEWFASAAPFGPLSIPNYFAPSTWLTWAVLIGINIFFIKTVYDVLVGTGPITNPILDALPKPVQGNYYGNAYLLTTPSQYKKEAVFKTIPLEVLKESKKGFIYLGMSGTNICGTDLSEHVLVLAPTGVGKTTREILQIIITLGLSDESICIFDPKGELFGLLAPYLKKQGFAVNRIDFSDPSCANRWNPLYRAVFAYHQVEGLTDRITTLRKEAGENPEKHAELVALTSKYKELIQMAEFEISQVIALMFPRPENRSAEGAETFWNNGAENVLKMVLHFTAAWPDIPDEQRNVQTALMLLQEYMLPFRLFPKNTKSQETFFPLDELICRLPMDHPAYQAMKTLEAAKEDYRRSFMNTASVALAKYASHHTLADMMTGTDFPIDELCDSKTATFIIAPETKKEFQGFAQLYINQMYSLLMDKAETCGGTLPRRMNMIAEELGQLPTINDLAGILSISRGKGMRWVLVLQDFARLNEKYGREAAQTIINNCAWQVLLETRDLNTAKHFSEKLGKYTTWYQEHSSSQKAFAWFNDSYSESGRTIERNLLTADEILRWKVEYGAIVTGPGRPAIVPVPPIWRSTYNDLAGLGNEEFNQKKVASTRAEKVHKEPFMQPKWRPEYEDNLRYVDEEKARTLLTNWLTQLSGYARQRRGYDKNDTYGESTNRTAKPKAKPLASNPPQPQETKTQMSAKGKHSESYSKWK